MEFKITEVRIFKIKQRGALLGYANIVINDCFTIKGIRILENERTGRFVAMPARRLSREKRAYKDLCHPLNQEVRKELTDAVFEAYEEFLKSEE